MKKTTLLFFIIFSIVLVSCANNIPAPTAMPKPTEITETVNTDILESTTTPCAFEIPDGEVEGETIVCGQIEVPQEWDNPDSSLITISYAILRAQNDDPAPDPIIYFEGGPGVSSLDMTEILSEDFVHLRQNRDVIFWDQRGNLFSSHVQCPDEVANPLLALDIEAVEATATAEALLPPKPTIDPQFLETITLADDPQVRLAQQQELNHYFSVDQAKANCRAYFTENGIVPEAYSTANSARDAVALLRALGYPRYNLYAISYGTTLALETMRLYEQVDLSDLPEVRSAVIDGVSPLYVRIAEQGLLQPYNVMRVFDTCMADPACTAAYPDIRQRLLDLLILAEQSPIKLNDGSEMTLEELVTLLSHVANEDKTGWAYLPRLVAGLEQGETALAARLVERYSKPGVMSETLAEALSDNVKNFIDCNDRSGTLDAVSAVELLRTYIAPQLVTNAQTEISQIIVCENWSLVNEMPLPEPVQSDIRTLVSNGAMDSATAPEWGEMAFTSLPNAVMVNFPLSYHGASVGSDCAKDVTVAFFDNPEAELDFSCVATMQPSFALLDDELPPLPEETNADVSETVPDALSDDVAARLDEFLQAQVYTEGAKPSLAAPGVVLLVDTPDGRYLQAAGVSNMEEGTPMRVDDRLEIGSNTKSFTVVLLMQLVEEGILSLDDLLSKWLPDLAAAIPNGDQMTLHQLAQHTTGIWDYGDEIIGAGITDLEKLIQAYTPAELVQYAIDNGAPDFTPGEEGQWKYSNTGYILLGMVIETASGDELGDLYQTRIFNPLGLETAVFIEDVPEAGEITDGYWWTDEGDMVNTSRWNASQGWAAGSIAMIAEDLLAYAQALSTGELFQDADSLAQMLTFDPNGMEGLMPYGLGLIDFSNFGAPGYWGHEGQTAGFQTLWYTNPDTGITVVGLSNSASYQAYSFLAIAPMLLSE